MNRTIAKCLMVISIFIMAILAIAFSAAGNKIAMMITFVIWVIAYIVLSYFARCPNCGRWPGKHDLFAHYCPRCGEPLD